ELLDVDEDRALLTKYRERRVKSWIELFGRSEPHHADALALERMGVEQRGIIRLVPVGIARRGIGGIASGNDGQKLSSLAHARSHRAGGILAVADRNDMRPADQPNRRLQP